MHETSPTWEELRGLEVAWWLENTACLRICIEKIAKAAFQRNQDSMDDLLFYIALRKKNVLTHLFKTIRNEARDNFFMNDFDQDYWQKRGKIDEDTPASLHASKQLVERSMAFWMLKDYTRAAHTLVQKAQSGRLLTTLSDIFNFYSYLRKHPLVVRQRLNNIGAQVGQRSCFLLEDNWSVF
ncbi:unnamed protein product [Caenorhabditis brenneri]